MKRTLFTGFAPNQTPKDVRLALGFLFFPWKWLSLQKGPFVAQAEQTLQDYCNVPHAIAFDSGRSALLHALQVLEVGKGDEVLVQAYTCVVVTNAIKWASATPVYVDVTDEFNMDPEDLKKKITPKAKAVIIQHTFGMPADLDSLLSIAKNHSLKTIEDCAHSLGAKYKGQLTGTFADIGMLSFGSDKVVSSVRGGALITKNSDIAEQLRAIQTQLPQMSKIRVVQHLLSFPIFSLGKKFYMQGGKILLGFAKKFHLIPRIILDSEKRGVKPSFFPTQFPNALAAIFLKQMQRVEEMNAHRHMVASVYNEQIQGGISPLKSKSECMYLRYPIIVENPKELFMQAKKQNIFLGDWYDTVIAPKDIDMAKTSYIPGSCPKAEYLAARSLNLPTNRTVTPEDAKKIAELIHASL